MKRSGRHLILGEQRAHHVVVARHAVGLADEDEAILGVDVALVVLGEPDVVLDLLVRDDAADEQEVQQTVGQHLLERRAPRRLADAIGVDGDGEDAGVGEAERLELAAGCTRSRRAPRRSAPTSVASSCRPSAARRKMPASYGAKKCAGVTL